MHHGLGQGVHEQADAHAQGVAFIDQGPQPLGVGRQVPTVVAGELVHRVGHEGGLVRAHRAHQLHQVVKGVALDVELGLGPLLHQSGQLAHVRGPNVTLIRPGVDGDALTARLQAALRGTHHTGNVQVA